MLDLRTEAQAEDLGYVVGVRPGLPAEPDEKTIRALLAEPSTERAIMPALQKGASLLARVARV